MLHDFLKFTGNLSSMLGLNGTYLCLRGNNWEQGGSGEESPHLDLGVPLQKSQISGSAPQNSCLRTFLVKI